MPEVKEGKGDHAVHRRFPRNTVKSLYMTPQWQKHVSRYSFNSTPSTKSEPQSKARTQGLSISGFINRHTRHSPVPDTNGRRLCTAMGVGSLYESQYLPLHWATNLKHFQKQRLLGETQELNS